MLFDDLLKEHIGECGRWQKVFVCILGIQGIISPMLNLDTVFTVARPPSWCHIAQPPTSPLSRDEWLNRTVPWSRTVAGDWRRDPCHIIKQNSTSHNPSSHNASSHNATHLLTRVLGGEQWGSVDFNGSTQGKLILEKCTDGYDYDNSTFHATLVTRVKFLLVMHH